VHELEPMELVTADGDKLLDPEDPEFYAALSEVMTKLGADLSWRKWFTEQVLRPKWGKMQPLYNRAFQQYYNGLEASDFRTLESYLRSVAQNHGQRVASLQIPPLESNRADVNVSQGFPQAMNVVFGILRAAIPVKKLPTFTPLQLRAQVLADLQNQMHGEKSKAQKWLEAMEYHPEMDIFCHPLVPLAEGNKQFYALLPWLFCPVPLCSEQWNGELFFRGPRSKWKEAISEWYGDGFRDYVADVLRGIGTVPLIEREISRTEFGDQLTPWLKRLPLPRKEKFTPDIILQKGDTALVISCKAEDLYFDYWLLHNYLFMPASKVREAINKNVIALKEVNLWGECIARMHSVRQRLDIHAKKILPVLVTSRKEPVGSPVLRRYFSEKEATPAVPAVTTDELKEFVISGPNVSLLPLPHPPQIFTVDDYTV